MHLPASRPLLFFRITKYLLSTHPSLPTHSECVGTVDLILIFRLDVRASESIGARSRDLRGGVGLLAAAAMCLCLCCSPRFFSLLGSPQMQVFGQVVLGGKILRFNCESGMDSHAFHADLKEVRFV